MKRECLTAGHRPGGSLEIGRLRGAEVRERVVLKISLNIREGFL